MRRATECFSMYSDISMRTMASRLSNRKPANALHNSVLPTPVGPRNRKEPLGRFGSDRPARERRTALETAAMACACPTTDSCSTSSIRSSFSRSPSSILLTGTPVHLETTSAISSSVTLLRSSVNSCEPLFSASASDASCFSSSGIRPYCNSDIFCKSPERRAASNSSRACSSASLALLAPSNRAFSFFQTSSSST